MNNLDTLLSPVGKGSLEAIPVTFDGIRQFIAGTPPHSRAQLQRRLRWAFTHVVKMMSKGEVPDTALEDLIHIAAPGNGVWWVLLQLYAAGYDLGRSREPK